MLTVPVYNPAGEKVGEESIDPADFGGEVNKQLLHDVVLMHLAARRVGTVNTRGRADVAGSGKKLFRQKGTGNARAGSKRTNKRKGGGVAFARRNRDYRYIDAQEGRPGRDPDGPPLEVPGRPGAGHRRPGARRDAQDQGRRQALRAIRRPDLTEAEATESVGETKAKALRPDARPPDDPDRPARRTTRSSTGAPGTSKGCRSPRSPSSTPTTSSSSATCC